jgi:hypothetical protein
MIELLIAVLVGIPAMSFAEYAIHRWLMHRPSPGLWDVFVRHVRFHHGKYYKVFNHEPDLFGRRVNLHIKAGDAIALSVPMILLLVVLGLYWAAAVAFVIPVAHAVVWSNIPEEMHDPASPGRFFCRWRLFRFLRMYHFLHHQHPQQNFNVVLPLWDYVLGTAATATEQDLAEAGRIGIL